MPDSLRSRGRLRAAPPSLLRELTRPWAPPPGTRVIAAVSGGADSVALGLLLASLAAGRGWELELATLDHGLRGDAGARDRRFVENLAREEGLPCHSSRTDAASAIRQASTEMAAREARRAFLLDLAESRNAVVALGHTRDDQAETLLYRLARGSGLLGAGGMRRWTPPLWRPLLGVSRGALRRLLREWNQSWVHDESNAQRDAARNRIRLDVLPALERAVEGSAAIGLARAAELAAEDEGLLEDLAAARAERVPLVRAPECVSAGRRELAAIEPPLRRRIVRTLIHEISEGRWRASSAHLRAIDRLIEAESPGKNVDLPEGFRARRAGAWLLIERPSSRPLDGLDK